MSSHSRINEMNLSLSKSNIINSIESNNENELNSIYQLILNESNINSNPPFASVKKLSKYIRRNRNNMHNINKKINDLLKNMNNVNMIISIVNTILDLVVDKRNYNLNNIIDILIKILDNNPQLPIASIEKMVYTIGDLIKVDNISIQKYLEFIINRIISVLAKQNEIKNTKIEYAKFYLILLLSKIVENSSLFAYNIITAEQNFANFQKVLEYFKDPKLAVRYSVGELIKQFNQILKNRDYESKSKYQTLIFDMIFTEIRNHIRETNGEPNNINLISGIFFILKNIYLTEPSFLIKNENIYINLLEELNKCLNSKNVKIKMQYMKLIPELYKINKEAFKKKYLNIFFEEFNKYLIIKSNNDIRKTVLVTLGYLSLHIKKEEFNMCLSNLISILRHLLNEKNNLDDEIYKCLADLLNNKHGLYMETILTKFDVNAILRKIFKKGLTTYKIEFLTAIMGGFSNFTKQYISTAIASLHAVSLIICDEDFKFEYFFKEIESLGVKNNFIDDNLEAILVKVRKYIREYVNEIYINEQKNFVQNNELSKDNNYSKQGYISCKCLSDLKTIIYALTLFSRVEYNLFLKDMLVFYVEKILPLLPVAKNKIRKNILSLLNCKFIKIYSNDKNFSEFLLSNIIDSLSYLFFNIKDTSTQTYAFQILQDNDLLMDKILKNKDIYCNRYMGLIISDIDKEVKRAIIQLLGNLVKRSKEKKYFYNLVKTSIYDFLFQIDNCDDIVYKEDLMYLIYYISIYLKDILDVYLIEKILESLIHLNINNNYEGIIFIMSLKIAYELISCELINYNFLININYSKIITKYCYILLILVVNNLKEGGDNTIKTNISLKILFQIIKLLKIDIYKEFNPNIILESLESINIYQKTYSIKNNDYQKKHIQNIFHNYKEDVNAPNINNFLNIQNENELLFKKGKNENINIVEILIQSIIKGQSDDEDLSIIMNIFGLSGSMNPLVIEKYFVTREVPIFLLDGLYEKNDIEENIYEIQKSNNKNEINEEINLSDIEPIKYKSILYILRILRENTHKELINQIISNFNLFIANLSQKEEKLAQILIPEIIQIIPNLNNSNKSIILSSIIYLIHNYKKATKENLKELVDLAKNLIMIELYFVKCFDIFKFLFLNFVKKMEIYYNELIKIFLSFIKFNYTSNNENEKSQVSHIIDLFLFMTRSEKIYSYLNIILDKLIPLFLKTNDFDESLIIFFEKITRDITSHTFYPILINALIEKIKIITKEKIYLTKGNNSETILNKEGKKFIDRILHIFKDMYIINAQNIINIFPMILKNLSNISIIKASDYENIFLPLLKDYPNYIILNVSNCKTKKISSPCFPFCKFGFTSMKFHKNSYYKYDKNIYPNNLSKSVRTLLVSQNPKNIKNKRKINRKDLFDEDLIVKAFDISNCLTKNDWYEWFKSTKKVLFEQSPSIFLRSSKFLADYYYPLVNELYNYSFLDIYKNMNEINRRYLSSNLSKALENPKTPNEILLAIISLEEFSERKNVDMCFLDNYLFGRVSYKCKAYAKALYFFENNFINKNDFNDIKDLLELYYELKFPESAIGLLLKSSGKNKNKIRRNNSIIMDEDDIYNEMYKYSEFENFNDLLKEKEYIFYIKMHDFQKALDIITELLEKEKNYDKKEVLIKNQNICLNGLYDWEQLLLNNDNYNELDEELYGSKGIYDINTNINNKNKISVNIELNEDNEDKVIKNKIEKEILLSKACMNLGKWKELESHLIVVKKSFWNREDSKISYNYNSGGNNEINFITISSGGNENNFYINHTISFGSNLNFADEDVIRFNKYMESYNNKTFKERKYNKNLVNRISSSNLNINPDDEKKEYFDTFINFKEMITENQKLSFLEDNEDVLFELNLYSSIVNIEGARYNLAKDYIYEAKKTILSRIKSLLNESYVRGYELLLKNQLLFNLEQIIDYKKNHFGDKLYFEQIVNLWDKNLNIIGNDLTIYENFLAIRSLVLPIEKEYIKHLDFVKICRRLNMFNKGEKVLLRLKNKLTQKMNEEKNDEISFNNIFTEIELSYNKCLFEKGQIIDSIEKSKLLIDKLENYLINEKNKHSELINDDMLELNDKIKSKIYGNYAIFNSKVFDFEDTLHKEEEVQRNTIFNFNKSINLSNELNREASKLESDKDTINHYFNLALKLNNTSYNLWHNYAMFNYKYYKYILAKANKGKDEQSKIKNKDLHFAINAVNGFKNSLFIGGKNKKKTFQDILRLLDIFFSDGNKNDNLLDLIKDTFDYINIDVFLNVIPQLLSRFNIQEKKILDVLIDILTKIGLTHPHAVLPSLIVMKHSISNKRKLSSEKVLEAIINQDNNIKKLINEYEIFIDELNKCAMLPHEEWSETIEDILKVYQNEDYNSFMNQMMKLHEKINKKPSSMYEINFYQKFISELKEAEDNLHLYKKTKNVEYIKMGWELYHLIYAKLIEYYHSFQKISLEYISPRLYNFKNSNIIMPNVLNSVNQMIYIKRMGNTLRLFNTKQHPRQMTMIGTDNKEYMFLLKGHEDLRQDERVMQLFDLVNIILAKDKSTSNKKLFIDTYTVFPISHDGGIIGWVKNCDTLYQLIIEQRMKTNTIPSLENKKIHKLYPKFETGAFLTKVEAYKDALNETNGTELKTVIWEKSKNCETWLNRRTNYSRSLAVMSMVGYILGLGDRHPSNLMMSRKTGKIIHIDFGDCFEITMKREKFPERIPFRLTRMLIKALEVSGIEGTYRLVCIQIMELLRKKRDSLLAILGSFVDDPLISFRLMIPHIIRKRKMLERIKMTEIKKGSGNQKKNETQNKRNKNAKNKINNEENIFDSKFDIIESRSMKDNWERSIKRMSQILKNNEDSNKKDSLKIEDKKVVGYKENEDKEKEEKKKMEDDERLIFNLFEENDEIQSEELNKIAEMVFNRIKDKLSGTDIYPDSVYDAQSQVDKLITQATSFENLAQSYLGWCPFW